MGTALVSGAIRAGVLNQNDITGYDPYAGAREAFATATGASVSDSIADLAACDVLLLCTKPNDIASALRSVGQVSEEPKLAISIAAGITLAALEANVPPGYRVIRAMPNTPALVGKGAAAFCAGSSATPEDSEVARLLLGSVGIAVEVPEKLMDAVTGLSGSGPAYVYLVIEALADGGVNAGLSRQDSIRLAAQTVLGAATMVMETGEHPAVLKDMVTSPGGTTIAALATLENHGIRAALIEAVGTAVSRAKELGK